ncbi:hypothetical protein [Mycobacterium sp. MYCO198283]|nr:hypothetical protein [Mycobacterium sp. MYCO198283]
MTAPESPAPDSDEGTSIEDAPTANPGYSTPPPEGLHHGEDGE